MPEAQYQARLFGTLVLSRQGQPIDLPRSSSARGLLAYLLLNRAYPHTRSMLAGAFWPEDSERLAKRKLSQALWHIRRAIPDLICVNPDDISIPPEVSISTDVEEFITLILPHLQAAQENTIPGHADGAFDETIPNEQEALYRATRLYVGDLLEGFYDDWTLLERERLREYYLQVLGRLVQIEKIAGRYNKALHYAQIYSNNEPYHEAMHREIMQLYVNLQRPESALEQYQRLSELLSNELNLEPEPETLRLVREITRRKEAGIGLPASSHIPSSPKKSVAQQPAEKATPSLPLIGRDQERTQLATWTGSIYHAFGGSLLIEGEAGVGKSRLVEEVSQHNEWRGAQVLRVMCQEIKATTPYSPLIEALQSGLTPLRCSQLESILDRIWLQVLRQFLPQCFQNISEPPPPLDGRGQKERLINAINVLLVEWSKITPLLIILEDLHWMDEDTFEIITHLSTTLRDQAVFLLGTYRGAEARGNPNLWSRITAFADQSQHPPLVLQRLNFQASAELIRYSLDLVRPAPLFENRLFQETEGNPLFLLETLRTLHEEGLLSKDATGEWHTPWDDTTTDYVEIPLPASVEHVIAKRIAMLTETERELIKSAAVMGSELDFTLLSKILHQPIPETLEIIRSLANKRLLEETLEVYRFSHDKILQVAYQDLSFNEATTLHRQIGEVIESVYPGRSAALATHFYQGQVWKKAVFYNRTAGDQATSQSAHHDAILFYTQALDAIGYLAEGQNLEQLIELHFARQKAYAMLGNQKNRYEDLVAAENFIEVHEACDGKYPLQLALHWSDYWEDATDYAAALKSNQKAALLATSTNDICSFIQSQLNHGRILRITGELAPAKELLERSYQRAVEIAHLPLQVKILKELGAVNFDSGDYDKASHCYQNGLKASSAVGEPSQQAGLENNLGNLYHYLADYETSVQHYSHALELWKAIGNRRNQAATLYNQATMLHDWGDQKAAHKILLQVCEITHSIGDRLVEGYGQVFLGLVLEAQGEYKSAAEAYQKALQLRRETNLPALAIDAIAGLARVASKQKEYDLAEEFAIEVLDWFENHGAEGVGDPLLAYQGAYRALLAAGQIERGKLALERAYALLMQYAHNIKDEKNRQNYLHNIEPNKSIWEDYHQFTNKVSRRQAQILRLLDEAQVQGEVLTINHIANILSVDRSTIKRDLAQLRRAGHTIHTRGAGASPDRR